MTNQAPESGQRPEIQVSRGEERCRGLEHYPVGLVTT